MQDINKSGDRFQFILIALGVVTTLLFGYFLFKEAFPEYKIYQKKYIELEDFRSTFTGEPPPEFSIGIRQIVQANVDKGPFIIDRCISCHVALTFPHFSPEKIAYDANGNMIFDENGIPKKVPNPDDVWTKLDLQIAELEKEKNFSESNRLKNLKQATVQGITYDVTKVLRMHPLIGAETRAFEFHPVEEYGCTSCHNGNGLALTTEKAHGPVMDGYYEVEYEGPVPEFTEKDPDNDPIFAKRYNGKPGHALLFQTTPLFLGSLIQAKCVQCHQTTDQSLNSADFQIGLLADRNKNKYETIQSSLNHDQAYLVLLLELKEKLKTNGLSETIKAFKEKLKNDLLDDNERSKLQSNLDFLIINPTATKENIIQQIEANISSLVGSNKLVEELEKSFQEEKNKNVEFVDAFIKKHIGEADASGLIFKKLENLNNEKLNNDKSPIPKNSGFLKNKSATSSDVDILLKNYNSGRNLFVSQACYACHRISGISRGGVGPELTEIGNSYPWYIKQKIIWPQSTLKNSTMPRFHLDHDDLEDVMTFLLGQTGRSKAVANSLNKIYMKEWESGKKNANEKPLSPSEIYDLKTSRTIFATEGCAACHRLKGFESNVGFALEKENPDFQELYKTREWFKKLVPESIIGSELVEVIDKNGKEIDKRIVDNVRKDSIIEEIEQNHPGVIESFYNEFTYAVRGKNHEYQLRIDQETDPVKKQEILNELEAYKARVSRVLMVYIQEYGLGRIIGPILSWSGVYRSDEWLMEHFRAPQNHVANSIMPIFPFDDTKFYALTYMLDVLGKQNRNQTRAIWQYFGFSPELAFKMHCASCHGDNLQGNGPVSEWIYPIPKNLRNGDFLRNLTKENAVNSIQHGVKGTPMAPWGEAPVDKMGYDGIPVLNKTEVQKIVDWIFSLTPGEKVIESSKNVPKWQYEPENIHSELKAEGLDFNVDQIFDQRTLPFSVEKNAYFIKPDLYTKENIEEGKKFFEMNCAVCHGKEADGTGERGSIMQDAKPRKLTNLDWLSSRDDLRLLRSIKYGVPGTSMGAWGDLTTSTQRLQLVMFIRSLSQNESYKKDLFEKIYDAFDQSDFLVEKARSEEFGKIDQLKNKINQLDFNSDNIEKSAENFKQKLNLQKELSVLEEKDALFLQLKKLIKEEARQYNQMGQTLIEKKVSESIIKEFIGLVDLNSNRYKFEDKKLTIQNDADRMKELNVGAQKIIKQFDEKIEALNKELDSKGEDKAIVAEIKGYEKLKKELMLFLRKVVELMKSEEKVLNHD